MLWSRNNLKIALLLSLSMVYMGCNANAESADEEKEKIAALPVEAKTIERGRIAAHFSGAVTLETEGDAVVVAKTGGIIEKIMVEEGQWVKVGQVLARLENNRQVYQLNQAKANHDQMKAELRRNSELKAKELISVEDYDRSMYAYDAQKAAYDLAKLDKEYTIIKAPITGIVAERSIKVGNMVQSNEAAFRIINYNELRAVLYIPEIELHKLKIGQQAVLAVDALADEKFNGAVSIIAPIVDPVTGTVKVTVEFTNTSKYLKPGMFGRVNIMYNIHENALLLPKESVLAEDRDLAVFVVRDTIAVRQLVTLGIVNSIHYEVLSGIEVGDVVITTGQSSLKDSTRVTIVSN